MRIRIGVLLVFVFCMAFTMVLPAEATIENLKSFKDTYSDTETELSCAVCHQNKMGGRYDLNAYGLNLKEFKGPGDAKTLTEDDYIAIEDDDADEDGASNFEEIEEGTDPADPDSVPEGFND